MVEAFKDLNRSECYKFKTLTLYNGKEFSALKGISKVTDADLFFARPITRGSKAYNKCYHLTKNKLTQ